MASPVDVLAWELPRSSVALSNGLRSSRLAVGSQRKGRGKRIFRRAVHENGRSNNQAV